MVETFLSSLVIGYSGAIMPGSLLTYTLDRSLRRGAKAGFIISIGHSVLELFLLVLILFGFGKYLQADLTQTIIGIAGGTVLCLLGTLMLKDSFLNKVSIEIKNPGSSATQGRSMLVSGMVISALNPYFIIWWAVVGLGLIMAAYNALGIPGVVAFYLGHITSDISWYSFVSLLVSKTKKLISPKAYRALIAILGAVLVGFGVRFIITSISFIWKA